MVVLWKFIITRDQGFQDLSKKTITVQQPFSKVTYIKIGHIRKRLFSYSRTYLFDRKEETPLSLSWKHFRVSWISFLNFYYCFMLQTKSRGIIPLVQQFVYKNGLESYWTIAFAHFFRWTNCAIFCCLKIHFVGICFWNATWNHSCVIYTI